MKALVMDASMACQLLLPEPLSGRAEAVVRDATDIHAPDLMLLEVANVFWKRVQRKELEDREARMLLSHFLRLDLRLTTAEMLLPAAMEIALASRRTVYASCYIALARSLNVPCVTADQRLVNALRATEYGKLIVWLGDL
jgi:predicted nucleic acid-binding protein